MPLLVWMAGATTVLACSDGHDSQLREAAPAPESLRVVFEPSSGTFVGAQTVTLDVEHPGAEVHYTLDGSLPSASSPLYEAPLVLEASTRIRALAIATPAGAADAKPSHPGGVGDAASEGRGAVASEAYLRLAENVAEFTSHLPVIVIHTFESGPLDPHSTEHAPATLMLFEPERGTTTLLGRARVESRIGIHVRGSTSREFVKKQFSVELREDGSDADLDRPLLGMPPDSDWVLSDPLPYDRSMVRNALAFALSQRIGRYAPRTRFVEVYLADADGDVRQQNFLGFYTLIEKIKRGRDRVDVEKLDADDAPPRGDGGFILAIDKGDQHFEAGGKPLQFVYPEPELMLGAAQRSRVDYIQSYIDDFVQAASAPDHRHPASGRHYSELIDVDAWIDHHILNVLAKNVDALRISAYFSKDRAGRLVAGPIWDFDRSLGTPHDERAQAPAEWRRAGSNATDYFTEGWWRFLFEDPAFEARYRDRFLALLETELAPAELRRVLAGLVSQVGAAAERNFARWPDSPPRGGSYAVEVALLEDFLLERSAWIHEQLTHW